MTSISSTCGSLEELLERTAPGEFGDHAGPEPELVVFVERSLPVTEAGLVQFRDLVTYRRLDEQLLTAMVAPERLATHGPDLRVVVLDGIDQPSRHPIGDPVERPGRIDAPTRTLNTVSVMGLPPPRTGAAPPLADGVAAIRSANPSASGVIERSSGSRLSRFAETPAWLARTIADSGSTAIVVALARVTAAWLAT